MSEREAVILGIIALAIAAIGAAYALLVLRSAPQRRDNLAFGALAMVDAAMTAWRGINVLAGETIIDSAVTVPCTVATIALAALTVEFIVPFPHRPAISWKWRAPMIAWAAAATVSAILEGHYRDQFLFTQLLFFSPMTLIVLVLGYRSWRLSTARDVRAVIAMLWFRWVFGFSAYVFAPMLGIFEAAVWAETTFATLVSFVVIGTAVLRSELFSIRSAAAEVVTMATIALITVLGGGVTVWVVLRFTEPSTIQSALLVGATLVPLALAGMGSALYPRVERGLLAGLDERRARRLNVQRDPLPTEAAAAIEEATRRIAAMSDHGKAATLGYPDSARPPARGESRTPLEALGLAGTSPPVGTVLPQRVRWLAANAVPASLAEELKSGLPLRRDERPDLPACLIVPALGAERALVGAFYISNGVIDRDTYLVARDVAARIALIVERAEAIAELEGAKRLAALGQFAAAIAHDIRTPLTSISLNVQILRRKLELSDDDREHLDIALEELGRLDRSVAEILDFAKPVRLATETIDVGQLIETAASTLEPVLSEKQISLRTEVPSQLGDLGSLTRGPQSLTVQGDPQRLRQVLVNLVGNAADASAPGTHVTLRAASADNGNVAIEVEDNGRGIGAADLLRIFEPFFTTRPDGTGLGLAICHKVVRAHGGDIRVRSTVGEGSTFTVVLPAA